MASHLVIEKRLLLSLETMMVTCNMLILGGTADARQLAERLIDMPRVSVTLSLAGRTAQARSQPGTVRVGGFGGVDGLARYLTEHHIDVLVDATHPFAAQISANAVQAARKANVPLVALARAQWERQPGDQWIEASDVAHAASLLGSAGKTVFLAIGRQEVAPFVAHPQHRYIVRSIDPVAPQDLPDGATVILDRGPFDAKAEKRLFEAHGVEIVVAKNSGGSATYGKIAAARALDLPVVMVARPQRLAGVDPVESIEMAVARIRHLAGFPMERGE
jgi:precorrin-6A/cobalt-precorrin-6A reductase